MAPLGAPRPPEERWRAKLAGTWVEEGETSLVWYCGAILPDGAACLLRARVTLDWERGGSAPYRLGQWAIYAGEAVLAWGRCDWAHAERTQCLADVERIAAERGIGFGPPD